MPNTKSNAGRLRNHVLLSVLVLTLAGAHATAVAATGRAQPMLSVASSGQTVDYDVLVAFIAFERQDYAVASRHFLRAAQVVPRAELAEYAMRSALLAEDSDTVAAAGALWSQQDDGNPVSVEFRVRAYSQLRLIEAAVDELDRLRELNVDNGLGGYLALLPVLFRDPGNVISVTLMERLAERYPTDVNAQFAMADLATRFRLLETAIEYCDRALRLQPDYALAASMKASVLGMLQRNDEALAYLEQFLHHFPASEHTRAHYARLLADLGRQTESYAQYQRLAQQNPAEEDYIYLLAELAVELGDFDAAWAYYLELIVRGERSEEAKFMLGEIEERKGEIATAISWYSAVGAGQYYVDAQLKAAQLLAVSGNTRAALAKLDELRDANPIGRLTDVLLAEGDLLVTAGRLQQARDLYSRHLDGPPQQHVEMLYARAQVARQAGNKNDHERDLLEVLRTDDAHHPSLLDLGMAMTEQARYREAMDYLSRALELAPEHAKTLASYGWLQFLMGRTAEAVSYLERAAGLDSDPQTMAHLGEALWTHGKRELARLVWHRGLALAPNDPLLNDMIRDH